jgi:4-hydroxy-2-oxoheptanedioate aldolase
MNLKEKMRKGPVYGIAVFTGFTGVVEAVGNHGYDFVFLDLEHTPLDAGNGIEKLIMSALRANVSPLVRTADGDEVTLRKLVEMGAEGVIVPHTRTADDVAEMVRAVKFPPLGRRGADSAVRAARFGGPGFSWDAYIADQNDKTMVIPMDEDYEFTDNIEAILDSPCVDAVNFGPLDYALSVGVPIRYDMSDPKVAFAFKRLVELARPKGIGVMAPCVPPTPEYARTLIEAGANMLIMGNDLYHFQKGIGAAMSDAVAAMRKEYPS